MEQLVSKKRQNDVNADLFEAQEVCEKFNQEKIR
jgi:hypothetical protein